MSLARRRLVICALLLALVWIVYGRTLSYGFVNYDDDIYVCHDPQVTKGLSLGGMGAAFTRLDFALWHPLTTISHMLDWQCYGPQAGGHHLTNVLLHSASVLLLFLLLTRLTNQPGCSAFVAALFAVHPLNVESVAWVTERKDVLSALFFMLTLAAYLHYARAISLGRYLLVAAMLAAGLMAKAMLVTVPLLLLLLDYWPLGRSQSSASFAKAPAPEEDKGRRTDDLPQRTWRELFLEKIPLLVLSLGAAAVTLFAQGPTLKSLGQMPLGARLGGVLVNYLTYLRRLFWPTGLAPFYPGSESPAPVTLTVLAALFLAAVTLLAFAQRKRRPYLLVGGLWYLAMLLPVIGLLPGGLQLQADRFSYLPSIGLFIALTWGLADLTTGSRLRQIAISVVALVAIGLLACSAARQASYWRDSETLWRRALAVTPDNDVAENFLGQALLEQKRFDGAIACFERASKLRPDRSSADDSFGQALLARGRFDEAILHLKRAAELRRGRVDQRTAQVHLHLADALCGKGSPNEAIAEYEQAGRLADAIGDTDLREAITTALTRCRD